MGKARHLANLLNADGDVKSDHLDNVPASNDASALSTGTLPAARLPGNLTDTGTEGTKIASGTTAQRGSTQGQIRFNTDTGLAEYYDGNNFKPLDAPPTVESISPTSLGQSVLGSSQTIVITGFSFSTTVTAKIIGDDGTVYTPASTTRDSSTQVTITTPTNLTHTNEPYDIQIVNQSSLSSTLADALSINDTPVFATASGSLGTLTDSDRASSNLTAISFSDEESTPTVSVTTGSLPSGITLNSNGTFSGTANAVASDTTSTFTVTATDGSETATRQYTITVQAPVITFDTASGSIGTIIDADRSSYSFSAVTATVTSGTLSYAVQSGSLPSSLSLNTTTGAITGTLDAVTTSTTSTFTIRATTTSASFFADRQFTITVLPPITIAITSGSIVAGLSSTLNLSATNTDGTVDVIFKEGNTTLATVSNQSVSSSALSVTVPSAVYNQSSGDTIKITVDDGGNVSNEVTTTVASAPSGGSISTSGSYRIHTFTSSGTFTNGIANLSVEYLIVAGGGGGMGRHGGGGGAGGYRTATTSISATSYGVTIGGGGSSAGDPGGGSPGGNQGGRAGDGSNSSALGITSNGGGGGSTYGNGGSGGSGGGGGWASSGGSGTSGQGNNGGAGPPSNTSGYGSGGGGGASSAGGSGGNSGGGGGNGSSSSISGSSVTYAGGGGGGAYNGQHGSDGSGGGSTSNRGGGGRGGGQNGFRSSQSGGSGIVIIRYQLQNKIMAHYAKVNNGIVEKIIVAEADYFDTFIDNSPGEWIQTSYNTRGGVHYEPNTDTPSDDQSKALRKNYAGVGYTYDSARDAFIPPKPYNSWTLNETTCWWESPIAYPSDGEVYLWNEEKYQADNTQGWEQV